MMANHARQRGQSLVEMALALPLLLILLVGVVDVGRAMYTKIALTNASREGARYASHYPADAAGVAEAVASELEANSLETSLVVVTIEPDPAGVPAVSGGQITVTLVYPFDVVMGGVLGADTIEIGAATSMIVFGGGD